MRCLVAPIAFLLTIAMALPPASAGTKRLWIDTDAACNGAMTVDVDDCWALALALHSPGFEIVGISTVFGNRDNAPTAAEIAVLLHRLDAPDEIAPVIGATGPLSNGAPGAGAAANAMAAALDEGPMTILALGPVTNVAAVLRLKPGLAGRIEAIVAVAGQRPGEQFFPGSSTLLHVHDMNFRKDVEAFEVVLESGRPLFLAPYRAGSQVSIDAGMLDEIAAAGTSRARWLAEISRNWLRFWELGFGASAFHPFDLVAAGVLVHPKLVVCRKTTALIVRRNSLFTVRDTLEVDLGGPAVRYCDRIDPALACRLVAGAAGMTSVCRDPPRSRNALPQSALGLAAPAAEIREIPRAAWPRPG